MPTDIFANDTATPVRSTRASSTRAPSTRASSTRASSARASSTRATATSAPPRVLPLYGGYYPGAPSEPECNVVVDNNGYNIRRSDAFETHDGTVLFVDDPRAGHCARCSCNIDTRDSPRAVFGYAPRTPGGAVVNNSPSYICEPCADNHTWTCFRCETRVDNGVRAAYAPVDDDEDRPLCPACAAPRNNTIFGRLINYSNKEIGSVPPKDPSGMLYGWEVEVHLLNGGSSQRAIDELHRILGPGYYVTKPDGSVENGFEIVTRPDSMAVHREEWCRFFEAIKESEFLRTHLRSWEAPRQCCGIHCHIDKDSLSALQLGKLATWINHPNNRSFIEKVAGRGSGSYTSFSDGVRVSDGRRLKQKTSDPERYVALNVQSKTAEMRIFRGTLQPRLFFKNMDFVEASVEWTGLSSCSARHVSDVSRFARYVYDRRERFPFLYDKLVEWKVDPSKDS